MAVTKPKTRAEAEARLVELSMRVGDEGGLCVGRPKWWHHLSADEQLEVCEACPARITCLELGRAELRFASSRSAECSDDVYGGRRGVHSLTHDAPSTPVAKENRRIPAGPTVAHVAMLLAAGMTRVGIAGASGVSSSTIDNFAASRSRMTYSHIAEAILAVEPPVMEVAA